MNPGKENPGIPDFFLLFLLAKRETGSGVITYKQLLLFQSMNAFRPAKTLNKYIVKEFIGGQKRGKKRKNIFSIKKEYIYYLCVMTDKSSVIHY